MVKLVTHFIVLNGLTHKTKKACGICFSASGSKAIYEYSIMGNQYYD